MKKKTICLTLVCLLAFFALAAADRTTARIHDEDALPAVGAGAFTQPDASKAGILERTAAQAGTNLLHSFSGLDDGCFPGRSLILSDSTLYGLTLGNDATNGNVFRIATDGSAFTKLHEFNSELYRDSGSSLAMMGAELHGVVEDYFFRMNPLLEARGNRSTVIRHVGYADPDGFEFNVSPMVHSDSDIFTIQTWEDDPYFGGTLRRFGRDGSGYTEISLWDYNWQLFNWENHRDLVGSLTLSGSTLYGTVKRFGPEGKGGIFRVGVDGRDFAWIHLFSGGAADGEMPVGSLLLSGTTLYGVTQAGGSEGKGTLFRMQTDGSGFAVILSFAGGAADGANPDGSLCLQADGTLVGMTRRGGDANLGTIFAIGLDGGNFRLLHEFTGAPNDGALPDGALLLSGSVLYGQTMRGGEHDLGAVFSFSQPTAQEMELQVARRDGRSLSLTRPWGRICFHAGPRSEAVARFEVQRRQGQGDFLTLRTVFPDELREGRFEMTDKNLQKGVAYTYRVLARDAEERLLGTSAEKSI